MSTIDHKAEAERLMNSDGSEYGDQGFGKMTDALKGQIAATLYLAEQQRAANLIALGQFRVGVNDLPHLRHLAVQPVNEHDIGPTPDIARALGLDKEDAS